MECLAKRGAISRSIAWIASLVSVRGQIVEHAGRAIEPAPGPFQRLDGVRERRLGAGSPAIASISAMLSAKARSNAGRKCSGLHAVERRHLERRRPLGEQRVFARAGFRFCIRRLGAGLAPLGLALCRSGLAAFARHRSHVLWPRAGVAGPMPPLRGIVETARRVVIPEPAYPGPSVQGAMRSLLRRSCCNRGSAQYD